MTTKNSAGLCPTVARADLLDAGSQRTGGLGLAAAALLSLCVAGPAVAQDANQLGLCSLSADAVDVLEVDVADGLNIDSDDVEVAFIVVYSLNNDNHGQPVDGNGAFTGPVLCSNPAIAGVPDETSAETSIPEQGMVDILDSAEAFLLRYAQSETEALPEARFCHTTNANVDCFILPQPEPIE